MLTRAILVPDLVVLGGNLLPLLPDDSVLISSRTLELRMFVS